MAGQSMLFGGNGLAKRFIQESGRHAVNLAPIKKPPAIAEVFSAEIAS